MGIRDKLLAHDARFISFSDLLAAVAEANGVTSQEAARAFALYGVLKTPTRLRLHGHGGYANGGDDALEYELQCALNDGSAWRSDAAQSELNMGEPGFFRDEIALALKDSGIAIPRSLCNHIQSDRAAETDPESVGSSDERNTAERASASEKLKVELREERKRADELQADLVTVGRAFVSGLEKKVQSQSFQPIDPCMLPFVPRTQMRLDEAASILAGDERITFSTWWDALADAADSGQIEAGTWGAERGEQRLSHADIRAWCERNGISWPVPLPRPLPSTMPATEALSADQTRTELNQARERIVELEAEVTRLREAAAAASLPSWAAHDTRLFRLLPAVIDAANESPTWPKQAVFIPDLMARHGLTNADARALDAVTRPDDRRGK